MSAARSVKFYGKNVNDGKFADYQYIGSAMTEAADRQNLIDVAYSIAGPVYGPLIAMTQETAVIMVLQV